MRLKQSEYIPGDLVKASGQLCRVEEVFVNRLTKEYEYTLIYPNGNSSRIVIGEIEPIPLTPKILEKNGWNLREHHDGNYDDTVEWYVYHNPSKTNISLRFYPEEKAFFVFLYGEEISENRIQYVHQLQHLLFGLTFNSELKI